MSAPHTSVPKDLGDDRSRVVPERRSAARESLAERYKEMAHEGHEHRGVDTALRAIDLGIAGTTLVVLSPL